MLQYVPKTRMQVFREPHLYLLPELQNRFQSAQKIQFCKEFSGTFRLKMQTLC